MCLDDSVMGRRREIDAESVEDDEGEFFHGNTVTKINSYLAS